MTGKEDKAVDLVAEGRVTVTRRDQAVLAGRVVGEHGEYRVVINPEGHWCQCEHGKHRPGWADCSHVLALRIEEIRQAEHVGSR